MELFSPGHILVVAIVAAFLFFGWKYLPDMSRSLGRSLRIFRTEIKGMAGDDKAREDDAAAQETGPAVPDQPKAIEAAPKVLRPETDQTVSSAPRLDVTKPRPRPTPNGSARSHTTSGRS